MDQFSPIRMLVSITPTPLFMVDREFVVWEGTFEAVLVLVTQPRCRNRFGKFLGPYGCGFLDLSFCVKNLRRLCVCDPHYSI